MVVNINDMNLKKPLMIFMEWESGIHLTLLRLYFTDTVCVNIVFLY